MELKPGARLQSAVCDTQVVVVRPPSRPVELACGGHPMVLAGEEPPSGATLDPAHAGGTLMGKRYADPDSGIELLCSKAGEGSLTLDGAPIELKDAKPLPASD